MNDYTIGLSAGVAIGALIVIIVKLRDQKRFASDVELAHHLSRRRARLLPIMVMLFITQQATGLSHIGDPGHGAESLRLTAWLALSIVLLLTLFTGGFWFTRKEVRALIDDEGTRENRRRALGHGFVATMLTAVVAYVVSFYKPLGGREVVHLIMMVGIGAALFTFARAERRDLADG